MGIKSKAIKYLEKLRGHELGFGEMIYSLRKADEISQITLAKKLGMTRAYLCDIEKGRRTVSLEKAMQFAKAMGYSPDSFVARAINDQLKQAKLQLRVKLEAA